MNGVSLDKQDRAWAAVALAHKQILKRSYLVVEPLYSEWTSIVSGGQYATGHTSARATGRTAATDVSVTLDLGSVVACLLPR